MRLCLLCKHMAAAEAIRCGYCSGTFGGRRCSKDHLNPPGSDQLFCSTCGRDDLTVYSPSINFAPLARLLCWWLVVGAGLYLLKRWTCVVALGILGINWVVVHVFSGPTYAIQHVVATAVAWALILLFASLFLPQHSGHVLRCWLWRMILRMAMLLFRLGLAGIRGLVMLVQGSPRARRH